LEFSPEELGLSPDATQSAAWAAIMDIYMDTSKTTVTLTSFSDGHASIYLSPGGGYVGNLGNPKIRDAAMAFVRAGAELKSQMVATDEFPLPQPGEAVFYIRSDRTYRAAAPTAELDSKGHAFSKLWDAGQEVITQYRLTSNGR
jgi:hypothetical protein